MLNATLFLLLYLSLKKIVNFAPQKNNYTRKL